MLAEIKFDGWAQNYYNILIAIVLVDLNLVAQYRIIIHIILYVSKKYWWILMVVAKVGYQTTKFNSPPNFPAIICIQYIKDIDSIACTGSHNREGSLLTATKKLLVDAYAGKPWI